MGGRGRARIESTHLQALERLVQVLADAGRREEAADALRRLLMIEPVREEWHRELIGLLGASGELALALRQYHECRRHLKNQFGVGPGSETHEVYCSFCATAFRANRADACELAVGPRCHPAGGPPTASTG